jgi:hypothetical protein
MSLQTRARVTIQAAMTTAASTTAVRDRWVAEGEERDHIITVTVMIVVMIMGVAKAREKLKA